MSWESCKPEQQCSNKLVNPCNRSSLFPIRKLSLANSCGSVNSFFCSSRLPKVVVSASMAILIFDIYGGKYKMSLVGWRIMWELFFGQYFNNFTYPLPLVHFIQTRSIFHQSSLIYNYKYLCLSQLYYIFQERNMKHEIITQL